MNHGYEYEVEISKEKDKGVAVLKLFGPNGKKEHTIMINKSKKHDVKFVEILAMEIMKPLLDKFENGCNGIQAIGRIESARSIVELHNIFILVDINDTFKEIVVVNNLNDKVKDDTKHTIIPGRDSMNIETKVQFKAEFI